ncbi:hypothetical protein MCHI_001896 [Candidatus Magnetoovum chiemensis]|nr:hypothetical protein MCHI_001896 [Candidatus Magnetoovum chiemensis]
MKEGKEGGSMVDTTRQLSYSEILKQLQKARTIRKILRTALFLCVVLLFAAYGYAIYGNIRSFDAAKFNESIKEEIVKSAPIYSELLINLSKELKPIYKKEIEKQYPDFSSKFSQEIIAQRDVLADNVKKHITKKSEEFLDYILVKNNVLNDIIPEEKDVKKVQDVMEKVQAHVKDYAKQKVNTELAQHIETASQISLILEEIGQTAPEKIKKENELVLLGLGFNVLGSIMVEQGNGGSK